jgi:hypothetical protein
MRVVSMPQQHRPVEGEEEHAHLLIRFWEICVFRPRQAEKKNLVEMF